MFVEFLHEIIKQHTSLSVIAFKSLHTHKKKRIVKHFDITTTKDLRSTSYANTQEIKYVKDEEQ